MLYPIYIHTGDEQHAHGVTIPDFPGCFSAADSWEDIPRFVQESVELYCDGEDMELPAPTALEVLARDSEYSGGVWMLVDVDLSRLMTKAKRVNVTIPENLLVRIDRYAEAHHMTRSGLFAQAASRYIAEAR
ncbi:MAG: type II toxin-antitoxin system HicB family antitoxin [Geobacter sp.]|nr:type II toxin-antitoxin system HicB family antitoxin [Geobacter sp.]